MLAPFAAAGGLLLGSFLNVVALRLPKGESLVRPRSRCGTCQSPVRPYDNVPVLSWLLLRGRCRSCGTRIAARYPLVEAATALLMATVAAVHTDDATMLVLGMVLVGFLVPITLIDLEHKLIPNLLTGPAAVVAITLGTLLDPTGEPTRLIAGAAAGGLFLTAALLHPGGMGMGDVKLAGVMGLFLGTAVAPALLIAFLSGFGAAVVVVVRMGLGGARKTAVPFGPFLALGAFVGALAGDPIVTWYLERFF
jgi:leader peptidase (prepilin peptidase)/N-methyltransferase